jgi:type III restriction enzyme
LRFIFSHSALGVGWDNPNVFQICTLAENRQEVDRRQKIGRGLRLCVNQNGERVKGFDVNTLTVVANESYEEFAKNLQTEIEKEDKGIKFGTLEYHTFANIPIKQIDGSLEYFGEENSKAVYDYFVSENYIDNNGKVKDQLKLDLKNDCLKVPEEFITVKEQIQSIVKKHAGNINIKDNSKKQLIELKNEVLLDPEFIALWDNIKYKTVYSIEFDTNELIEKCTKAIQGNLNCDSAIVVSKTARLEMSDAGISTKEVDSTISGTIDES